MPPSRIVFAAGVADSPDQCRGEMRCFHKKIKKACHNLIHRVKAGAKTFTNSVDAFLAVLAISDALHLNSVHFKNSHEKEIRFTICLL